MEAERIGQIFRLGEGARHRDDVRPGMNEDLRMDRTEAWDIHVRSDDGPGDIQSLAPVGWLRTGLTFPGQLVVEVAEREQLAVRGVMAPAGPPDRRNHSVEGLLGHVPRASASREIWPLPATGGW
jgi:hypothetical protein